MIVDDPARVRDVLIPVYQALGLAWDPATVGSLASEVPGVTWESAEGAILARFAQAFELEEDSLPASVIELAKSLEPHHLAAL